MAVSTQSIDLGDKNVSRQRRRGIKANKELPSGGSIRMNDDNEAEIKHDTEDISQDGGPQIV